MKDYVRPGSRHFMMELGKITWPELVTTTPYLARLVSFIIAALTALTLPAETILAGKGLFADPCTCRTLTKAKMEFK